MSAYQQKRPVNLLSYLFSNLKCNQQIPNAKCKVLLYLKS